MFFATRARLFFFKNVPAFSLYRGLFNYISHTCEEVPRDKKPAKLLLFFHIRKYFLKKMHFFFIFFDFVRFG